MNIKKNKLTLALLLSALVLLSLTSSSLALPMTGLENELQQERQTVTVTTRAQGSTGEDVPLAGAEGWAQALVEINNAPDNAVVTSVRVKYHVAYAEPSDLEVRLLTSGAEVSYTLWNRQHAEGGTLTQSTEEITAFQGVPVNGTWSLAVQGGGPEGYIDDFSIVVYYETEMPVLQVESEGPPGTPAFLRLPEGATPASPSLDEGEKPSAEGSSVVPQHVPTGATIIKTEDPLSFSVAYTRLWIIDLLRWIILAAIVLIIYLNRRPLVRLWLWSCRNNSVISRLVVTASAYLSW